ncbi:hypothetical protein D3C87_1956090 [compost metagenome]
MAAGFLIQHGVVHVHQAVNATLFQHLQHQFGLIFGQRIGGQHFLLLEVIQIGAVAADCRGVYLQRLIKRVDRHVMAAGDDNHFDTGSARLRQGCQRLR